MNCIFSPPNKKYQVNNCIKIKQMKIVFILERIENKIRSIVYEYVLINI